MTIRRVLIANRGEIAVRIARACREAGIESVAVYSDADAASVHVRAADRAIRIGPAAPLESYLSIDALLGAARSVGADAVHPGYGFLSERAAFARACENAGLVFVGPPADVIEQMGSKIAARALMRSAGVPVVPGGVPPDQSDEGVLSAIRTVGYPALVKASAGGGGKGMRVVGTDEEAREMIPAARREAASAFGDGTLYIERVIARPRHVEIQILADAHGRIVHLFERECSVQRRHQKVVEESPSPALTPELRARMGNAAIAAARACGYRNAGTIEFLLEHEGNDTRFYFLEMNTRLQVEHPVTEAITGVDLVRAQLRIAAGEPLPWEQASLSARGHAVECRIYAEDPENGFLPQAGRLLIYREPAGPGVRVDSGVEQGSSVTVNYDPLLAKLIACGENRGAAIARAKAALRSYPILGIRTNIPFLLRLLDLPAFDAGALHTGLIEEHAAALSAQGPPPPIAIAAAGLASNARGPIPEPRASGDPWAALTNWGREDSVSADGPLPRAIEGSDPAAGLFRFDTGIAWAVASGDTRWVFHDGRVFESDTARKGPRRSSRRHHGALAAPMPATVREIKVAVGDRVLRGDTLLVLEAMKMELPVRADADGTVTAVHCRPGELVQPGITLLELGTA
jgi:acetyl-CoA carboxylase biotin carboxylase subunit